MSPHSLRPLLLLLLSLQGIFSLEYPQRTDQGSSTGKRSINRKLRPEFQTADTTGEVPGDGPPPNSDTTLKAERDWMSDSPPAPFPRLFYRYLEGRQKQLIWNFEDTLARDVLAGQPEVWLHTIIDVDKDADLLPHVLEHYTRLEIAPERMIFTLHSDRPKQRISATTIKISGLAKVQAMLHAFGADYRLWIGRASIDSALEASLLAIRSVPIKDWIVIATGNEFIDFGGMTAQRFLEQQMREGSNWIVGKPIERLAPSGDFETVSVRPPSPLDTQFSLSCNFTRIPVENRTKVVAFRGFLRPDAPRSTMVAPEVAEAYFGGAAVGDPSPRDPGDTCGGVNMYVSTPYSKWWAFYRTPLMVGNAYLWHLRRGDDVTFSRYRWHAGQSGPAAARQRRLCEAPPSLEDAMFEKKAKRGKVRVAGAELLCRTGEPRIPGQLSREDTRLPLPKDAAIALANILQEFYPSSSAASATTKTATVTTEKIKNTKRGEDDGYRAPDPLHVLQQ